VRFFSPASYVQPLQDMGVTTVIRLSSRPYETSPFESAGIRCLHLDLDEGEAPPSAAVAAFLDAVHVATQVGGAVAVHCKEGLGRTGTMVAAYLMAAHGFSAREAMGWMRIVRPGSVVGSQQHFLSQLGEAMDRIAASACATPAAVADHVLLSLVGTAPLSEHAAASPPVRSSSEDPRVSAGRPRRVRPQSSF
jgi:cell division cycle 14